MITTYSLTLKDTKTYLFSSLFILGNILLPQICHLIPQGGLIFLPIYFFTLIGAYRYGLIVGLFTAIFSPLVNHLLFGMPPVGALPAILLKSALLAVTASFFAKRLDSRMFLGVLLAVLSYQLLGGLYEYSVSGLQSATQDFRLGWIGIIIQIVFGYRLLAFLRDNNV